MVIVYRDSDNLLRPCLAYPDELLYDYSKTTGCVTDAAIYLMNV